MAAVPFKYIRPPGLTNAQWSTLAGKAYTEVRKATPVDTGRLKSSWEETGQTSRSVSLKTRDEIAPYAGYVAETGIHQDFPDKARTRLDLLAGKMIN